MLPTLLTECSDFLIKSGGLPLIKNLPELYPDFKKIKVRKKKIIKNDFITPFNRSFSSYADLMQRSVFANKNEICPVNYEPFYIFPINNFKFMYNIDVGNITSHYDDFFKKITTWLNVDDGSAVFSDVIKSHFITVDLKDGIGSNSEIIIYGINYYYAMRKSSIVDYKKYIYNI